MRGPRCVNKIQQTNWRHWAVPYGMEPLFFTFGTLKVTNNPQRGKAKQFVGGYYLFLQARAAGLRPEKDRKRGACKWHVVVTGGKDCVALSPSKLETISFCFYSTSACICYCTWGRNWSRNRITNGLRERTGKPPGRYGERQVARQTIYIGSETCTSQKVDSTGSSKVKKCICVSV